MSKAFTKEDDEIPERVGRVRSASGLPPGAVNYMTAEGGRLLRAALAKAKGKRAAELQQVLNSVTIVPRRETPYEEVLFGASVTVRSDGGEQTCYRVVGVDEAGLEKGWISWVSPLAKALLGQKVGKSVQLSDASPVDKVKIVEIS